MFAYFAPADVNIQKVGSDPWPSANHVSRETMGDAMVPLHFHGSVIAPSVSIRTLIAMYNFYGITCTVLSSIYAKWNTLVKFVHETWRYKRELLTLHTQKYVKERAGDMYHSKILHSETEYSVIMICTAAILPWVTSCIPANLARVEEI
jgi:hypothetical protein